MTSVRNVSQLDPPPTRSQLVLRSSCGTPCWLRADSEYGGLRVVVFLDARGAGLMCRGMGGIPVAERARWTCGMVALDAKLTVSSQE